MNIYYFANQIYQFSYAKPIYEKVGGSYIVKKQRKNLSLKINMRNMNVDESKRMFFNAPEVLVSKPKKLQHLQGLFFSLSNSELKVGEKSKTVFIGHGTGDKKYRGKPVALERYDYIFLSGPKYEEKLKDVGLHIPEEKFVRVGNLRFDDYLNNRFNKSELMDIRGIKDRERNTILYAPTWGWGNGTLLKYFFSFAKEITKEFNLIVRPHHFDSKKLPLLKTWAKLNGIKNLYFSNPKKLKTSDTYQDFLISDLLISDTSSVLYEYLITKKPIIIALDGHPNLHNMPDYMNVMKYADLYDGSQKILSLIRENLEHSEKTEKLSELLNNCFYHNDGKCTQRAIDFIRKVSKEIQ